MSEIRTNKLVLVDHQDVPRVTMAVTPEGVAELTFTDTQGNERLRLAVSDAENGNDTVVHLRSTNQGPELELKTNADGGTALSLMRRTNHPLVVLEVESWEDARPCLTMFDPTEEIPLAENGKIRWSPTPLVYLTATEDPEAYLQFLTPKGSPIERFPD